MYFASRADAGKKLALALAHYKDRSLVVYGIRGGGEIIAREVAASLNSPVDILVPHHANRPAPIIDADRKLHEVTHQCGAGAAAIDPDCLQADAISDFDETRRLQEQNLVGRDPHFADGKVAIIVDDRIASGLTIKLAIDEIRARHPERIVVGVPVIPAKTLDWLSLEVDEVIALETSMPFSGTIAEYFEDYHLMNEERHGEIVR